MTRFAALVLFLFLAGSMLPASAQDTDRRSYDVDGFHALGMSVYGTAYVSQGDAFSVEIDGPTRILDAIEVSVKGDQLTIEYEQRGFLERLFSGDWFDGYDREEAVDVYVTLPEVSALSISGTARLIGETPLRSDALALRISGAGEVTAEVEVESLTSSMSGSGEMRLTGTAGSHEITISGAGKVAAEELATRRASIQVSGAGECVVHTTDALDVRVSGAGSVRYKGSPRVTRQVSGVGTVRAL